MTDSDPIINGLCYGRWLKQKSRSTGLHYYTSPSPPLSSSTSGTAVFSIWYDPALPLGWGWIQAKHNNKERVYVNLWNPTVQQTTLPTLPAVVPSSSSSSANDTVASTVSSSLPSSLSSRPNGNEAEEEGQPTTKRFRKDTDNHEIPNTGITTITPSSSSSSVTSSMSSSSAAASSSLTTLRLGWEWIHPDVFPTHPSNDSRLTSSSSLPLYLSVNPQGNLILSSIPEFFYVSIVPSSTDSSSSSSVVPSSTIQCRTSNQKGILTYSSDRTTINIRKDDHPLSVSSATENAAVYPSNTCIELRYNGNENTTNGSIVSSFSFYNSLYQRWLSIAASASSFIIQQTDQLNNRAWFRPLFYENIQRRILSSTSSASTISSLYSLLRLPSFHDYAIAGTGKRSTVYRGHIHPDNRTVTSLSSSSSSAASSSPSSSTLVTCKIQPYDERVYREIQILDDLTYRSRIVHSTSPFDERMLASIMTTLGVYRDYATDTLSSPSSTGTATNSTSTSITNTKTVSTGTSYLFMPDYGTPLDALTPLPWLTSLRVWLRIMDSLIILHTYKYVHMDIHPGNILVQLTNNETPKSIDPSTAILTDYGSAQTLVAVPFPNTAQPSRLQYTGPSRGGRWDSMPLEQFGPGNYGSGDIVYYPSSDIYCSATTFLYCLTNKYLYGPENVGKLNLRACKEHPLRNTDNLRTFLTNWRANSTDTESTVPSHLPKELIDIIIECLLTDPFQRPQSAEKVKEKLTAVLQKYTE